MRLSQSAARSFGGAWEAFDRGAPKAVLGACYL